jgi:hypothetical protein
MDDKKELLAYFHEIVGEEGCCGGPCQEINFFKDADGWKVFLEGFMEPWRLGATVEEAKNAIKEYAQMSFGLS